MNAAHRATMQTAYRLKHARRDGEAVSRWRYRLDFANADINSTLALQYQSSSPDANYVERLYLELDEVRAAQLRAAR